MSERTVRFADPAMQDGFTQVPNVILRDSTLTGGARLTWAMLASYAWNTDESWPGQQTLADQLGVGDRQVRNNLTELEKAGLLEIKRRGNRKSNLYVLHVGKSPERKQASGQKPPERKPSSGEEDTRSVSTDKGKPSSGKQQCLDGVGAPQPEKEVDPVRQVFEKWNELYGNGRCKLTDKRRTRIKARLKDGRTAEELIEALEGAQHDDWLMGRKQESPGYTGIDTILRDDDQVNRLIKLHKSPSRPTGKKKSYERDRSERKDVGW